MASVELQEKANFTRLSRLLVDKGTEALRNTLDERHPPTDLPTDLNYSQASLLKLKPRVINVTQWDLLFPPSGSPPDSKTFDVTLLTVLLRNLPPWLPTPATGWDTMPPDTDNSLGANITRIKLYRNQVYAHVTSTQVEKGTFDHLWQKISKALVDLNVPQNEIDDLKICPLGPEEEIYEQSLKKWALKDEECKNIVEDFRITTHNQFMEQKASMQHLGEIIEQNHQGIQQLCASSTSGESELLQQLAKHNFRSKIRSKVKIFHLGTRERLLQKINKWFEGEDESRLLLLTAGPGFGKSVFAAKVCEIFEKKQRLAACHFCDFSDSNLKDPRMMLQSLASHMCQNIVGFKEKLLDQLKRPHQIRSLKDAFQIYLQNPLDELEIERFLIVIDGLDESATDDKSDMAKLIADNFPDLPECVKVLVTSRPELSLQRLDHIKVINIGVDNEDNESDIRNYLNSCLPALAARDSTKAIAKKCEGSFLYAFQVQHELRKREDLDVMTFEDIMAFLPKGMGFIYETYFRRLEVELKAIMKRNPDLFKLLELLVAVETELPLNFIARALDLPLDCRETKKVINKVNEEISCLLYVSGDLVTVFHKSVYDWLLGNGYDVHEYIVKVSDGKKRLWLLCEQVYKEIKRIVCSGNELKLTNERKHALEHGHAYLFASQIRDSFPWLVDMIIVHVTLNVFSVNVASFLLRKTWESILESDMDISIPLRQRILWHLVLLIYTGGILYEIASNNDCVKYFYLEAVLVYFPEDCFTDDERKIAEVILSQTPYCVKSILVGIKLSLKPLFTYPRLKYSKAVGVSSSKKLVAMASPDGTICVLRLPELIELWKYSTGYRIFSCTFSPDDTLILYGKLETVLNILERKEEVFFDGKVERFKSCAFSSNGKRLITCDGSETVKLWDVVKRRLVTVLLAGAPVNYCAFSNTDLFILVGTTEDTYCAWNSITLQRVDQRSSKRRIKDGVLRSEICNRCFRQERKELIPSKCFEEIVASTHVNRRFSDAKPFLECCNVDSKIFEYEIYKYKGVECILDLSSERSLHVIENIHFTTLAAWEFNYCTDSTKMTYVDIAMIEDDCLLYANLDSFIVFSSVPTKEDQSSMSLPTCVLWCSFSPDGTRLATCTSDGFINLWKIDTCQVYQRFRSNPETPYAACWWSDEYLFVCFVIDTIPCLSRYPVDETLKINITDRQLVPLWSVLHEFLPFSGLLEFSEGYLCFECGETEPVKVIDVTEPKKVVLPEMAPMMSIAVSPRASFVLGAYEKCCLLWRKRATQPHVYEVFATYKTCGSSDDKLSCVACYFSNDSKFGLVYHQQQFTVFDMATAEAKTLGLGEDINHMIANVFCTDTFVILLTAHGVDIFDLQSLYRLVWFSHPRIINEVLIDARLSLKDVLAVPRLTGDMEFLHLQIPKLVSLLNARN